MDFMLEPFAEVISGKLKMLVSTPLPCTDEKPPIALIDDKSTGSFDTLPPPLLSQTQQVYPKSKFIG